MRLISLIIFCVLGLTFRANALACSTYALQTSQGTLFGRNTDGELAIPGQLVVNKRGVEKFSLPWGVTGPSGDQEQRARWVSKFGSLTFTHFGREFPDGGVNEAGLIIEEMTLGQTKYPDFASRPSISVQQWIQYQLDNHADVEQVLADIDRFSLKGWPWHFTLADKQGNCATLEFINSKAEISQGSLENGCVLTNHQAAEATAQLEEFNRKQPTMSEIQDTSSESRFLRANTMLAQPAPNEAEARKDFAFGVLSNVAQGDNTFRSIVYDLSVMKVYFRSTQDAHIKEVSIELLDFSTDTGTKVIDFDTESAGEVTTKFTAYDAATNRSIVASVYHLVRTTPSVSSVLEEELALLGVTEEDFINLIAKYPETTRVAGGSN